MGISNTQYRDIMYQYDQTRMKNQRILEQRMEQLQREVPELEQIQKQILSLSMEQARRELLQPDLPSSSILQYQKNMQQLTAKKVELLRSHGYPESYLSPIYTCPDCKDTGYINFKPCHCLTKAKTAILYANSNLEHILDLENFNTFDAGYYDDQTIDENLSLTPRQNILRQKEMCMHFATHFDDEGVYDNLIFYGPAGVGKTFLTHCIAKELLDTGHTVVYLTSLQLFDILEKNTFGKQDAATSNEQVARILDSDLLIIDDLGTELTNSFTTSQLYHVIEERHLHRRSVIFSTNLSFLELRDRYSERIFSRFTGYYNFCKIIGADIRTMKKI